MHNGVTSHLWLKSALHASSHPCMCTCVLRLGCFLLACPVLYFVPPFSFQPFLMFTSEFNERSRSNPLCDFRLGTVVTSDYETPLTEPLRFVVLGGRRYPKVLLEVPSLVVISVQVKLKEKEKEKERSFFLIVRSQKMLSNVSIRFSVSPRMVKMILSFPSLVFRPGFQF